MNVRDVGEKGLISLIHRLQANPPLGYIGIGDDAAYLPASESGWVVSCDMLVEDVHFRRSWMNAEQLGEKAVAANMSDMAAMGALPKACLTSVSLPGDLPMDFVESLYRGLARGLDRYGAVLVGGDSVGSATGTVIIDVTVLGQPGPAGPRLRRGAKPGDRLVVSGRLGAARAGLELLEAGVFWPGDSLAEQSVLRAQLNPLAQVEAGWHLAQCANAQTDISDGLAPELWELTKQGGIGVRIYEERLPIDEATAVVADRFHQDPRDWVYYGGEDYELLAAIPPSKLEEAKERCLSCQVTLTDIGEVTEGMEIVAVGPEGGERPLRADEAFDQFHVGNRVSRRK